MINNLINLTSSICPFPHIIGGVKHNGLAFSQPTICKGCTVRTCFKNDGLINDLILCPLNKCYFKFKLIDDLDNIFIINGITVPEKIGKLDRKKKKSKDINLTSYEAITDWVHSTNEMTQSLENAVTESVNNTLGMLHDVKTAVSIIFRNTEELIYDELGSSMDEKVENASYNKKKLFKSVSLLEERLNMMSLVANPKAATHGEKKPLPVYKIFDKNLKLFDNLASKKKLTLKLIGTSYSSPKLYSSFTTIPLILVDNAIKYSHPYQDIKIMIDDGFNGIKVEVESFSLEISGDDKNKIFNKGFRGDNANIITPEGSGLGLYLADIVAYANNFRIYHQQSGNRVMKDGQFYVSNTFLFTIPK